MDDFLKWWLVPATAGLMILGLYLISPVGFAALACGIAWTKWRRREVPLKSFFLGRPAVLSALFFLAGAGASMALQSLFAIAHGVTLGRVGLALGAGGAAFAAAALIHRIVEGKIMPNLFDLATDKQALEAFLQGRPEPVAAEGGQFVDFSDVDPAVAIAAIREQVIGQDAIVADVVQTLFRRAQLRRKNKPLAVLMFAGATGSGKTELAKTVAELLFEGNLIRLDCAEMTEASSTQRLIGSPPGYLGSEQGGFLVREIMRMGIGVILLDEIEKAHADVYKLLLALMDEGRITEQATNRTASATGFVVILTTNAEHAHIAQIVRDVADVEQRRAQVRDALRSTFAPEQLARIDEIYSFGELDRRAVGEIVTKFLLQFAADVGVKLQSVDTALLIDLIIKREKLAAYGVREIVRLVEKATLDGMLDARAAGYPAVSIGLDGERVRVTGIPAEQVGAAIAARR
ncbi:MAG TPA: AAA family ATPase [Thiomonas arsenitoxydans]|uniref:AAA family ATPase n=1 Tax=Thiomonas TaxID=32012 RepID=UPI0025809C16|nr:MULTISPECIES: AAA family ATPase [Thiomonas]HML81980.1 AAA family ATPase [Thiomonas arsenitoxydans]